jgi:hypothetical protein
MTPKMKFHIITLNPHDFVPLIFAKDKTVLTQNMKNIHSNNMSSNIDYKIDPLMTSHALFLYKRFSSERRIVQNNNNSFGDEDNNNNNNNIYDCRDDTECDVRFRRSNNEVSSKSAFSFRDRPLKKALKGFHERFLSKKHYGDDIPLISKDCLSSITGAATNTNTNIKALEFLSLGEI